MNFPVSKEVAEAFAKMNVWGAAQVPFFFMLDFDLNRAELFRLEDLPKKNIQVIIPNFSNTKPKNLSLGKAIRLKAHPEPFSAYHEKFEAMQRELNYGNSYLINLTQSTPIEINLSLEEIFEYSEAKFKLLYKDEFVVFSPERFVQIVDNQIFTHPMKGTIDATLPNAASLLLENTKEIAEHNTIVDLLRNDLNRVARKVSVNSFRYIDEIITSEGKLLQISSKIMGTLSSDWKENTGNILHQLLPAGSVTGAPKIKTVNIIKSVETYQRGWYTGIFGIFDGKSLDSAVMIRFIEKSADGMVFKSGGGITAQSNAKEEYSELIQKIYVPIIRNDTTSRRGTPKPPATPKSNRKKH